MITETYEPTIIEGLGEDAAAPNPLAHRPRRRERLEFALPTINVIFLLMLYFLVAGTIVQKDELNVVPPETSKVPTDRLPRPLLSISNAGTMTIDGVPVERSGLVAAALAVTGPDAAGHQLNILAPAGMAAGPFLDILSGLAEAHVAVRVVTVEQGSADPEAAGGSP